jgi:hypothetical protein
VQAASGFDPWERLLAAALERMRQRGELRADAVPAIPATGLLASMEGGMVLSQTRRDMASLRQDATWEKTFARFDATCARNGGSLLQHDTSTDVARDMNLIRQAVRAPKLNFIALSEGTGIGPRHPGRRGRPRDEGDGDIGFGQEFFSQGMTGSPSLTTYGTC